MHILLKSGGFYEYAILWLLVSILIFLALREVACWYWKVNERIELQQEQIKLLKTLVRGLSLPNDSGQKITENQPNITAQPPVSDRICKKCNFKNKPDDMFCNNCGNKL